MTFKGKEYEVVIWDWLWTLYSRKDDRLFYWVKEYFEKYGSKSRNFLVSYAFAPTKRRELIKRFGIDSYFEDIIVQKGDKEDMITGVLERIKVDKSSVLVIGDNVLHEGRASKSLGLDYIPIAVWDEFIYSELGFGSK